MRSEFVSRANVDHVLAALSPTNRLVCQVCLETGLRLGDVLSLRTDQLRRERFSVQERKTGKRRRVRLSKKLRERCLAQAGSIYVFPGRLDGMRCRTRQAVWKDLTRAAYAFRVRENLTPHSLRKVFAVELMRKSGGDLSLVQKTLNHEDAAVTLIYALADRL